MRNQPIAHGTFTIERVYDAPPERVFAAWSDIEIKQRWFIGPAGWTSIKCEIDFVPGGTEILHGRFPNGMETLYTARFHDIVQNERIVYVYDMHLSGTHHSLSLSTVEVEVEPTRQGTRLVYTEQVAYLDGTDGVEGAAGRKQGVGMHLNGLGELLRRGA